MSTVAEVLGVSRSNLIERTNKPSKPRGAYRKPEDVTLLAEMRPIIDQRPTYGYRRLTALLNRQRRVEGKPMVNAKRVLRVMQQNSLTLQKHTALRPNVLCGNSDDHARNHAAFTDRDRLALTPAYDICPQSRTGREASLAMAIDGQDRRAQLPDCRGALSADR